MRAVEPLDPAGLQIALGQRVPRRAADVAQIFRRVVRRDRPSGGDQPRQHVLDHVGLGAGIERGKERRRGEIEPGRDEIAVVIRAAARAAGFPAPSHLRDDRVRAARVVVGMCDHGDECLLSTVKFTQRRQRNVEQHVAVDDERFRRTGISAVKATTRCQRLRLDDDLKLDPERGCFGCECRPK